MNLKNIIFIIMSICGSFVYSQNIKGKIKSQTGENIADAKISVLNSSLQTISDQDGNFTFQLKKGKYQLELEAVGFARKIEPVEINKDDLELNIELRDNTKVLDEVVVTGTNKIESDLQKTPAAVSVLTAKKLADYRAWNVANLTALAPSLMVLEHGNSSGSNFFNIRGTMGFTNEQSVATYVDGVYQFDFFSAPINFNNIEQIEIMRGPQGTLYGRNAFSGVINIITKKPTNRTGGYAELDFGNYGQQRYTLGINTPIVKDKLFFNISGQFNGKGSVYSNPTLGTDHFDNHKSFNLNGNLKYVINDRWQILLNAKTEDNKDKGAYPWTASYDEVLANGYKTYGNWDNIERRSNTNVSATVNYYGDKFNFTSVTSGLDYHIWIPNRFDFDFTSANLISGKNETKSNQLTQEFRFSSPSSADQLKWTVGSYLFTERVKTRTETFYDEDYALVDPSAPYSTLTNSKKRNKGLAFFGQATYSITPRFDVTAGLRYDVEHKEQDQTNNLTKDDLVTQLTDLQADSKTFTAFTPKLVLSYKINTSSLAYASYAKGFRVGGFNIGATALNYNFYKPEMSDNYEVGIKNNFFQNRLKLNVTAFYLQQKDQQVGSSTDGVNYLTLNAGDMNNFGIETEVAMIPVKNLSLEWNAAWSDAKYAKLELYDYATASTINYKNNHPINNPEFSSMLAAQYNYPIQKSKQNISLFLRGEYRYIGRYYLDFINTYSQPGYGIVNARAGLTAKNYEIAVWGRNINDKRYVSWGYGSYLLGSPRMYGVTLTGKF